MRLVSFIVGRYVGLLLFAFSFIPVNVTAQAISANKYDFNNVDLRSEYGPLRNQGDMGFCASYSTADMLSFWLKKYAGINTTQPGNMVSGLGTALVYNNYRRTLNLSTKEDAVKEGKKMMAAAGGDSQKALAEAQKKLDVIKKQLDVIYEQENKYTKEYGSYTVGINPQQELATQQLAADAAGSPQKKVVVTPQNLTSQKLSELKQEEMKLTIEYQHVAEASNAIAGFSSTEPEGSDLNTPEKICFEKDVASPTIQESSDDPCNSMLQISALFGELDQLKIDPKNKESVTNNIKNIFPKAKATYVKRLMNKFSKKADFDALSRLSDKSCKNISDIMSKNYPKPVSLFKKPEINDQSESGTVIMGPEYGMTADGLFKIIDDKLKAGEPVFIGYDAKSLYYPTLPTGDQQPSDNPFANLIPQTHASTIVGRLYDNQANEPVYIIRNSWGIDACECLRKANGLTSTLLVNDTKDAYYTNPANQNKKLSSIAAELYDANKEKYNNEALFKCDKGYFLAKKSVLEQYLYEIGYYIPVNDLKELPKIQVVPKTKKQKKEELNKETA